LLKAEPDAKEIKSADFQASLPKKASPSAKYFWSARRGPVKKVRKIRAASRMYSGELSSFGTVTALDRCPK
jgi:hypothetical protein